MKDVVLASLGLILALPLMAVLGGVIAMDSPGAVLLRQPRLGRGGREFGMWKFRTMRSGSESELEEVLRNDSALRLTWEQTQKLYRDPRLTRVGRWLRRMSLDELPQLWNVMAGEMSLVGPRPILPSQQAEYGPAISAYIRVRPGMTGLWQVSGRNRLSFAERAELDVKYLNERSFIIDLSILARTVSVVLTGKGAF